MNNLIVLTLSFLFVSIGYGILAPVYAYLISLAVLAAIGIPLFLRMFKPSAYKIQKPAKTVKKVFLFGIPMMLAALGGQVIGYMDTIMLTYFSDLATVGIYNVILPSALLFLFFGKGVTTVMLPLVSELHSLDDKRRITQGITIIYKYTLVIAAPFILSVIAFPSFFLQLFFGAAYTKGALAFQILLIGVLFYILSQVNESVLIGIGDPKSVTTITLIAAGLNIILNIFLIPRFGMVGAAAATAASYITMLTLSTKAIRKRFSFVSPLRNWTLTLISGIAFLIVVTAVKNILDINLWLEIICSLSAGMAVYLLLAFLLRTIDIQELKGYIRSLRRPEKR